MPRPKILHVLEATYGGTATYLSDLLLNIDTEGFDVSFVYSSIRCRERLADALEEIRARGIRVYEIPMQRDVSPLQDLRAFWQLYLLIRKENFDIVHGHSSKAGFLSRLAAKLANPRSITIYSPHAICLSGSRKYWYLERLASLFTNVVLGVSRTEVEELKTHHFTSDGKLRYATTGVDAAAFVGSFGGRIFRQKMDIEDDTTLIGSAGRIAWQKDPVTFVKTAAKVLGSGTKAHFAWAGDGELKSASEKLAKELGIAQHISFVGYCPDLKPFVDAVDIFALTSRYESFGYVTCEAMAMGKPVVATNVSGSKELVCHGVTGYLAEVGDINGLAQAIQNLAANEELRLTMGRAGQTRVRENYDLSRMVQEVEQLYRELFCAGDETESKRHPRATIPRIGVKSS